MDSVELKISSYDWIYIISIGALFGFFISLFFYFLHHEVQFISTITFSVTTSIFVAICASILITISNNFILPNVKEKFWYLISFLFSFSSGLFGFLFSFTLFLSFEPPIIELIKPFWVYIAITIGFLTFLIGLILHQFIAMKYKHEQIKSETLHTKIKTLENELNPHFLFNALNSMSELVYIDPKKAEKSILNLSKFLRNAIDTKSVISLDEELKMVQNYVDIENIRFEDKIQLHIKRSTSKSLFVPKFSIQLLVENSIKHGYFNQTLDINIQCFDDTILVSNNGKLEKNLQFGTGLSNLSKRLELLELGTITHKIQDNKMLFTINLSQTTKDNR
jgi:sensor histidine kinase YesM